MRCYVSDVNMPEATGLQLADAMQHLKYPPAVVFVTAYSEHAIEAFKVKAIDYLVKPVEMDRLARDFSSSRTCFASAQAQSPSAFR